MTVAGGGKARQLKHPAMANVAHEARGKSVSFPSKTGVLLHGFLLDAGSKEAFDNASNNYALCKEEQTFCIG